MPYNKLPDAFNQQKNRKYYLLLYYNRQKNNQEMISNINKIV